MQSQNNSLEDLISVKPLALMDLPNEMLKDEIGKYLSDIDKKQLAETRNKRLFSLFRDSIKPANKLIKLMPIFFSNVIKGEKKESEKMIKKDHSLLIYKATMKDEAGRQVNGTALQIALGAKDVSFGKREEMVEMIERYLKLHYGNVEIAKQYAEQFPEGWELQEEIRRKNDSEALNKVFLAIEASVDDEDCKVAIQEFRDYLKSSTEGVIKTGYHFNEQLFIEAWKLYENYHDAFCNNQLFVSYNSRKNRSVLFEVIAVIESYFTACLAQAVCDGLSLTQRLSRNKLTNNKKPFFDSGLGVSHFVYCAYFNKARIFTNAGMPGGWGLYAPQMQAGLLDMPKQFSNIVISKNKKLAKLREDNFELTNSSKNQFR